ncbi:MAG: glycoside hydrolase family 1 protein [Candidatus Omnitrophica bacterium]|nr:glycoside hydrolase family 1 protein [Candidatus Omnitrophota bacterium]MBU4488157.1 glycoside hydrolase family 1 protein [Candidatus Omnitrophota bacterium]MCG2704544.1 glycoside hydrolase family 1 protein [Candidatus Omnitrophota bacterium]
MLKFPNGFLWGSATSSHQVEGDNQNNDWWKWEKDKRVPERSQRACDQWNLYKSDFKLAKSLNHNAHRFSLEWSRIEPEQGRFDAAAVAHYRDMIKSLRSLGIEPIVTLNHFTLPLWFAGKGGWLGEGGGRIFASFAKKIARELGEDVSYWLTINEPAGHINSSYVRGEWPPGERSFKKANRAFIAMLKAHCLAYKAIHNVYKEKKWPSPKVSLANFTVIYTPCRPGNPGDVISAKLRGYYVNNLFLDSLMRGFCIAPGMPPTLLPLRKSLDFIGLNYYARDYVHFKWFLPPVIFGDICSTTHHRDSGKRNFLNWEIYPKGIYELIMAFNKRYRLPILITENGICTKDDNDRIDFIKAHLGEVALAIKDGAHVLGYLHWSLLDNFEWAHGYGPRFGLIEVDYKTQQRIVRPSARVYAEIIKNSNAHLH